VFRIRQEAREKVFKQLETDGIVESINDWVEEIVDFDLVLTEMLTDYKKKSEEVFVNAVVLYKIIQESSNHV
jgi:hypothetical protein